MQDYRLTTELRLTEQRTDVAASEKLAAQQAPQPIDPMLLQQVGGGITEAPGNGW